MANADLAISYPVTQIDEPLLKKGLDDMNFIFTQGPFSVLYVCSTVTPSRAQRSHIKGASEFPKTCVGLLCLLESPPLVC